MRKSSRKRIMGIISSLIIIVGIMLMLYPSFSNLFSTWYEEELRTTLEQRQLDSVSSALLNIDEFKGMILEIPVIGLSTAVQKGTSPEILKKTPGWYEESELPGQGNTAIAAHRNMYGSWFQFLHNLNQGDLIFLQHGGYKYTYETEEKISVESTDINVIYDCGYPLLTLTTCLEGDKTQRLVVRAKLIDYVLL